MTMKYKSSYHQSKVFCEQSTLNANSDIELESHYIINHKPELPALKIDRNEYLYESLELSVQKEVRSYSDSEVCCSSSIKGS